MNIFNMDKGIRKIGLNYGLPMWIVEFGPGISVKPEDLILRLGKMGYKARDWVLLKGTDEMGTGTVVEGLKFVKAHIEAETSTKNTTPLWFPKVDRWTIRWEGKSAFNLGALRSKLDCVLCERIGVDLDEFLSTMSKYSSIDRGLVGIRADLGYLLEKGLRYYASE